MLSFKSLRQALLMGVATLGTTAAVSAIGQPAFAQEVARTYDIQAQDLNSALREFALQTGRDVLYPPEIVAGKQSNGAQGQLTERQALEALLAGTGLRFEQTASNGYAVQDPNSPTRLGDARRTDAAPGETWAAEEEIVVIGTNIRGVYPASSPVDVYTAEDIARTGVVTTEQFIQRLPQNLGTRASYASTATSQANREGVSAIDLRGLGVGTTLTLLNGRRLGLASNGQAVDISMIPVSAIERVEVLTDGASAIYGSDAIGGVVNFVLREELDGAETRVSYGGVTDGGLRQGGVAQAFGGSWRSGRALASLDYFSASALDLSDREYAASAAPGFLTPVDHRYNALLTITQDLGERVSVSGDFIFSRKDTKNYSTIFSATPANNTNVTQRGETEQAFGNLGVDIELTDTLNASFVASYSEVQVRTHQLGIRPATGLIFDNTHHDTNHSSLDLTAALDGTLLELPAGDMRFSIGGGLLDENYTAARTLNGAISGRDIGRATTYGFGELFVPLLGEDQNVPLVHRLELSLAARYTNYDDKSDPSLGREFGERVVPKLGLLWAPTAALNLRATYGESFRAPSLTQLDPVSAFHGVVGSFPVGGVPSTILQALGPSLDLDPETAESYTIGFDFRPSQRPSLELSATYFNVDYQDRIGQANTATGLANPAASPDAVYRPSSAAQIEEFLTSSRLIFNTSGIDLSDPHAASLVLAGLPNFWIVDARTRNLAVSRLDGLDVRIGDTFHTGWGELNVGAQLTRIFDYEEQSSPNAPQLSVVDTVLRPVDLRGRVYAGLQTDNWNSLLAVNYVDDYSNPFALGGAQTVESWVTADWSLTYQFGEGTSADGLRLSLSVLNVFDEDPPFVAGSGASGSALQKPVGFDPANANPLGRLITVGIVTSW